MGKCNIIGHFYMHTCIIVNCMPTVYNHSCQHSGKINRDAFLVCRQGFILMRGGTFIFRCGLVVRKNVACLAMKNGRGLNEILYVA